MSNEIPCRKGNRAINIACITSFQNYKGCKSVLQTTYELMIVWRMNSNQMFKARPRTVLNITIHYFSHSIAFASNPLVKCRALGTPKMHQRNDNQIQTYRPTDLRPRRSRRCRRHQTPNNVDVSLYCLLYWSALLGDDSFAFFLELFFFFGTNSRRHTWVWVWVVLCWGNEQDKC